MTAALGKSFAIELALGLERGLPMDAAAAEAFDRALASYMVIPRDQASAVVVQWPPAAGPFPAPAMLAQMGAASDASGCDVPALVDEADRAAADGASP